VPLPVEKTRSVWCYGAAQTVSGQYISSAM